MLPQILSDSRVNAHSIGKLFLNQNWNLENSFFIKQLHALMLCQPFNHLIAWVELGSVYRFISVLHGESDLCIGNVFAIFKAVEKFLSPVRA